MLQQIRLLFFHKVWHDVKSVQIVLQSRILLFFSQHGTMLRAYGLLHNQPSAQRCFLDAFLAFVAKDFKRAYKLLMMRHQTPSILMLLLSVYQHQHNSDRLEVVESITSSLLIFRLP